jgi:hypothetical protein
VGDEARRDRHEHDAPQRHTGAPTIEDEPQQQRRGRGFDRDRPQQCFELGRRRLRDATIAALR